MLDWVYHQFYKSTLKFLLISIGIIAFMPVTYYYWSDRHQKQLDQDLIEHMIDETSIRSLVGRGANVNATDKTNFGTSVLGNAAGRGQDSIVNFLLDNGANIEIKNQDGATPLMYAAGWGRVSTVPLLLSRGANASAKDPKGRTARELTEAALKKTSKADPKMWKKASTRDTEIKNYQQIIELLKQAEAK